MQFKRITICVALAFAPGVFAAETATLDEVVVTAPAMEQPLVVKTDPRKPRQPVPAHDGADYLKTIPGFSVIRKGGTDGDPVFRGMAGSRLNILLDGEQVLGGCSGRMDPPTAYVFPAAYDRITVLKGPQTVLYGPGNSAGTVLFERSSQREQAGMRADGALMLGSFGRNDEMAEAHLVAQSAYLRVGGTRSQANDYRDGGGNAVHSAYNRWSGNAALGWTPGDDTRLELTAAKSDGKAAYADRSVDGSKFARDNFGLKFNRQRIGSLLDSIEAQLYYNYVDHVMDSYSLRAGNPAAMMAAMNPDRKTTGGKLQGTLNLAEATQLKLGIDTQTNIHTGRTGAAPGYAGDYTLQPRVRDASFDNVAVFGELHHDLAESGRVIAGLRADSWRATDYRAMVMRGMMGGVANPTANQTRTQTLASGFARFERDASEASTLFVGVGHTARAPDYWELFGNESMATASAFNTRPEKTTQLDAGLNYRADALSGSVSAFYSRITDFNLVQSSVAKGMSLVTVTRNVNATTYGAEADLAWRFAAGWKLDGSLAYVHGANDTDSTALGQIPPLEARLGINYDDQAWSFGGLLRGVAAQNRVARNQGNIAGQDVAATGGFGVFSVNGGWRANKTVQLSAGVDNLFNKRYAEHISRAGAMVSGFTQTARVNEMGRNLWLKANFKLD